MTGPSSPLAYLSDQQGLSSESEKGTWSLLGIKLRNDRKGNKAPPTTSPLDPCMEYGVSSIRCSLGINSHERKDEVTGLARGKNWTVVQAWQCPGQPSREPRGVTCQSKMSGPFYQCLIQSLDMGCPHTFFQVTHPGEASCHFSRQLSREDDLLRDWGIMS